MTRKKIFAANWKMNLDSASAAAFMEAFVPNAGKYDSELVIFPPALYVAQVAKAAAGSPALVGVQNIFYKPEGAYTGEVSAPMAKDCGATYVLCGHSERRHIFGESAEMVSHKARAAQAEGLLPMICVGETLDQREQGETMEVLQSDIQSSLAAVEPSADVVIAYEPVWAIGTGLSATPQDAEEVIAYLREQVRALWGDLADEIRFLYGGSVKPDNAQVLMSCPNIDGVLIGGASLAAESYMKIIENGELA